MQQKVNNEDQIIFVLEDEPPSSACELATEPDVSHRIVLTNLQQLNFVQRNYDKIRVDLVKHKAPKK
ncbi:hypothetical protein KIN20_029327 [Parelaphostrongylus tenuis]|uniref:Uncharacterized protein n=1 Tax=Parelaphostrongylus tenuis TaxID=148309 RepID=A0AAD5WFH0_PARTN|nr:hypothetical protein KIN20_029327 [Parelaphostrongylus tenuis]